MSTSGNFPNIGSPLVGQDGRLSPEWFSFLLALFNRTGGQGTPIDISALQAQVNEQAEEISDLFGEVNASASSILLGALIAKIAYLEKTLTAQVLTTLAKPVQSTVDAVTFQRAAPSFTDSPVSYRAIATPVTNTGLPVPARPALLQDQPIYAPPAQYLKAQNNLSEVVPATARTNLGLGTVATQAANAVAITGGAVDGVTLGATTPNSAVVTTLQSNGTYAQFKDSGSIFMRATLNANKNAWRFTWGMTGAATDGSLTIQHSTDNYVANFTNAIVISATTVAVSLPLVLSQTTLLQTSVALANGAAAAAGTLSNAPTAGNPTKWIPINDNGTTRYLPAW